MARFGRLLEIEVGCRRATFGLEHQAMAKSPFKFLQEVRTETEKVTWPTRRETLITTAMVFVMATLAAIFFLAADQVIRLFVTTILGIAG
jgi:preprotein translocase subunit SecE